MTEEKTFSAVGAYFGEINNAIDLGDGTGNLARLVGENMKTHYFKHILRSLAEIEDQHKEIQVILSEISGRNFGFVKSINIDHLILSIKFYIMSWSTLTDMVGSTISNGFNLGIAEADIQFGVVMRNAHVVKSSIPSIIKKHSKTIDFSTFNKHRNEIVHRGRILDSDVLSMKSEHNRILSSRFSLLAENRISEEEFNSQIALFNKNLSTLAEQKQAYYTSHYRSTLDLVSELLTELARTTIELYKRGAI